MGIRTAVLLLLLLPLMTITAIGSPILYEIQFTDTYNPANLPNPFAEFIYDADLANPFFAFFVEWDGASFDFKNLAGNPLAVSQEINLNSACIGGATGGHAVFAMLTSCPGLYWSGESYANLTFFTFAAADGNVGIGGLIDDVSGKNLGAGFIQYGTLTLVNEGAIDPAAIPEPGAGSLALAGLVLFLAVRIRRTRTRKV